MATSSSSITAPWRDAFLSDVKEMDQPSFTFSTLHTAPSSSSSTPRARTCIFRGLWASLPPNDKNPANLNPSIYTSDLPTITTDARMDKVPEIFSSPTATKYLQDLPQSGGGGPVEALFWSVPTKHQWRLRGHAWVLAAGDLDSANAKVAKEAIQARMVSSSSSSSPPGKDGEEWSWEREINAHFGNLSPAMRGSFKNPSPGTPRATEPGRGEKLGQTVGDELLGDELARKNFRVVVVVPETVELVDLKDPEDQRRWLYTFVGAGAEAKTPGGEVKGGWEVVELWP